MVNRKRRMKRDFHRLVPREGKSENPFCDPIGIQVKIKMTAQIEYRE